MFGLMVRFFNDFWISIKLILICFLGIVLWELFSLGKVPYTGMEANQNLYYKLRDGYRMERPSFATQDIYDIMLSCWSTKPETRPLFNELEKRVGSFLHESVKDVRKK
jgi:hypothetical protein